MVVVDEAGGRVSLWTRESTSGIAGTLLAVLLGTSARRYITSGSSGLLPFQLAHHQPHISFLFKISYTKMKRVEVLAGHFAGEHVFIYVLPTLWRSESKLV